MMRLYFVNNTKRLTPEVLVLDQIKERATSKISLDQEAQVAAYRATEFGEGKQKAPTTTTNLDEEVKSGSNWDTLKGEYNDLKDATKEKVQGAYDGAVATDWGGALASGSSKLFGAFTEGATNRGIHGDPNTTVDKATRISGMDSRLNLKNYDIDSNGNVVAKGIKGRMQRAGRDVGRFLGGATLGYGFGSEIWNANIDGCGCRRIICCYPWTI